MIYSRPFPSKHGNYTLEKHDNYTLENRQLPVFAGIPSRLVLAKQWRSNWGCKGGRVPPLTAKKIAKNREKEGEIRKKWGKKRRNREGRAKIRKVFFFNLPLLTDRAGYATVAKTCKFNSGVLL